MDLHEEYERRHKAGDNEFGCTRLRFGYVNRWLAKCFDTTNMVVYDFGCATGVLSTKIPHQKYVGWDFSDQATRRGRRHGRDCRTQSILEVDEQPADLVMCLNVLEHIPPKDTQRAADNIRRHGRNYFVVLFFGKSTKTAEYMHICKHTADEWKTFFPDAKRVFTSGEYLIVADGPDLISTKGY